MKLKGLNSNEDNNSYLSSSSLQYQALNSEKVQFNLKKLSSRRERHRLHLDQLKLKKYLRGPDVLDFPIGTGRLLDFAAKHYNFYGYDISPAYIERAKELFPRTADHFEIHSMELISSARQFNSIYSLRVTGHIKNLPHVIGSVAKIVAPGGRWIFNIAPQHPDYPRLASLFELHGLVLAARVKYDAYSGHASLRGLARRLYGRWMQIVKIFPVPFWLYWLVDLLMLPLTHTILVVAEKPRR